MLLVPFLFTIFLLSSGAFAGGFIQESISVTNCEQGKTIYTRKAFCEKTTGGTCLPVPADYKCSYMKLVPNMVDGLPILTKSETELCADESACTEALGNKVCSDIEEVAYINEGYSEVFCSKVSGYTQVQSGLKLDFDTVKKQAHDDAITAAQTASDLKKSEAMSIKDSIKNTNAALTKDELNKILLHLLGE